MLQERPSPTGAADARSPRTGERRGDPVVVGDAAAAARTVSAVLRAVAGVVPRRVAEEEPRPAGPRTVGVEEEFLLVAPDWASVLPVASRALATVPGGEDGGVVLTGELQEQQVETNTPPRRSLGDVAADLLAGRRRAARAARDVGARVVALGTAPVETEPVLAPSDRYAQMAERFGITATHNLICGCHVHVAVTSAEEAVGALDRLRTWLPVLLALSANSPYWHGRDTGYASYRHQMWAAWPTAGPPDVFGTAAAYRASVEGMLGSGVILDEKMVYLDARPSPVHPTLEIRAADVCLRPSDGVLLAGLCRALVETAAREWRAGVPAPDLSTAMLRLAQWQAARDGLAGALLDPLTCRPRPAAAVVEELLDHVGDALRDAGDGEEVPRLVEQVLSRGTGADRQRRVRADTGDLAAVIDDAARLTVGDE